MPKIHHGLAQGCAEWHALRKNKLGASCAPILMGFDKYSTPFKLWQQLLGLTPPTQEHEGMRRGKALEIEALKMYEEKYGVELFPYVLESDENPFMLASMDGITKNLDRAIEVKCLNLVEHDLYSVPDYYYPQMQHQMYVSGLSEIDYVALHPKATVPFYVIPVKRDEEYIQNYISIAKHFWDCVKSVTEPQKTEKEQYDDYSKHNDFVEEEKHYWRICEKIDQLTEEKEKSKVKLLYITDGKNALGEMTRVTSYVMPGRIDYKKIPVLENMDLECYRGAPTKAVRISKV